MAKKEQTLHSQLTDPKAKSTQTFFGIKILCGKPIRRGAKPCPMCWLPPLPPICIQAHQKTYHMPSSQPTSRAIKSVTTNKLLRSPARYSTEKLTFFLLARDYLVQKSWLQNIIQIIVLAIIGWLVDQLVVKLKQNAMLILDSPHSFTLQACKTKTDHKPSF